MLTPQTQFLFDRLLNQAELTDFVLIGGSALALRINHRISEDLDFNYLDSTLPKAQIDQLIRTNSDLTFSWLPNPGLENECFSMGEDVEDFHHDYIVSSPFLSAPVKITFSVISSKNREILQKNHTASTGFRVATCDELFLLKSFVVCERNKSRDVFDLYTLIRHHGYPWADVLSFYKNEILDKSARSRTIEKLCSRTQYDSFDEGYRHLVPSDAVGLDKITEFFTAQHQKYCQDLWTKISSENNHDTATKLFLKELQEFHTEIESQELLAQYS